jgi:hypothetical protein
MIPEGGFCGSAPGAATVCGDAYIALTVCTFASTYPSPSVRSDSCYTAVAKFDADLAREQCDETYARYSEP